MTPIESRREDDQDEHRVPMTPKGSKQSMTDNTNFTIQLARKNLQFFSYCYFILAGQILCSTELSMKNVL